MEVCRVITGFLDENCYVIKDNDTCLVVDPGDDYNKIMKEIGDLKILGVLITHSHYDHIGDLRNFLSKRGVKIFKKSNVEEKEYSIGSFNFEVIYTPGHSSDSITFYFREDKTMFVGDFIFKDSIGRCDLPTGSENDMKKSIELIKKYDKDTILYPGHYESSDLKTELENNPYLKD